MSVIITGSSAAGFLYDAVNELQTYLTPKKIIEFIKNEKAKAAIGNPPYTLVYDLIFRP